MSFDDLTKSMSTTSTRRGALKAGLAGLLGVGALVAVGGATASATASAQACARLGQEPVGQYGSVCCPQLTLDSDGACKKVNGGSCYQNSDCLLDSVCATQAHKVGMVCQPA